MRNLVVVTTKPASKTVRCTQRVINTDYHRPFSSYRGEGSKPETTAQVYQHNHDNRINVASGEDVYV